jgi:hypothetical protein
MLRLRAGTGALPPLMLWVALAGFTPTGLILAAIVALACVVVPGDGRPRWLCAAMTLGVGALVALPWLVASAVSGTLSSTQPAIAAFAARAERGLGTLGSLAGLGGIWNADSVPGSRGTLFAIMGSVVLLAVVAAGLPAVRCRPAAVTLLVLAAGAIVVPAAMATGAGIAVVDALVRAAPGLGVVRDGQKWVALAMPGYALAAASAVVTLRRWTPSPATAVVCCVALIVVLPDLVWGVGGAIRSVRYPAGWTVVASRINGDPRPVAVLPAGTMRRFGWSGPAPVLDPLPRWVRPHVWATGDLTISGRPVLGEGNRARAIEQLLLDGADQRALAGAGVGWLVVESGTPGETGSAAKTLVNLPVEYRDADVTLYRVGGDAPGADPAQRRIMVLAHLVWLAVLAAGAAGTVLRGLRPARLRAGPP